MRTVGKRSGRSHSADHNGEGVALLLESGVGVVASPSSAQSSSFAALNHTDENGHSTTTTTNGGDTDHHINDTDSVRKLLRSPTNSVAAASASSSSSVSRTGLAVLILLAVQNCSKNLLMRYVMKDQPNFLTSAAVLGSECLKLTASCGYILVYEGQSVHSIVQFLFRDDARNTILLTVPAMAYNLQMSLEYVALANLSAAMFSVLVQTKLLFTATFAAVVLRKQLKLIQVISLVLLTVGVMLCNLSNASDNSNNDNTNNNNNGDATKGIMATLGIALSSGFASVYTEKVIKAQRGNANSNSATLPDNHSNNHNKSYSLAYTQVQLAFMSLVTIGVYACVKDWYAIVTLGLFHNFTAAAFASIANSALGGLIVAAVLKYADSVLKGYATAMSVILTGVLSMILFGTSLSTIYFMGIVNVVTAVLLYNGKDLDQPFGCFGYFPASGAGVSK